MTRRLAIVWNPSKTDQDTLTEGLHAALTDAPTPEVFWWETTEDDPGGGATGRAVEWNPDLVVVAGGDGTVRAVAEHLAGIDTSLDVLIGDVDQSREGWLVAARCVGPVLVVVVQPFLECFSALLL